MDRSAGRRRQDGDGFDNGVEPAAGTDPIDPDDFPSGSEPLPLTGLLGRLLMLGRLIAAGLSVSLRRRRTESS